MTEPRRGAALCPICRAAQLRHDVRTSRVSVWRCVRCGHRVAEHTPASRPGSVDYHRQYEQTSFLGALEQTRLRQAERIAGAIRRNLTDARSILDFGAGRGWFLQAARRHGFRNLAGADTSELAVRLLRRAGFEAHELAPGRALPRLSFEPDVLTALDVIEHFPPDRLLPTLQALLDHFRPRLVALKVPVSSGILYRTAAALGRVGVPLALEQLYQVGSEPPHESYFSQRSLLQLLEACGLRLVDRIGDRDFEPASLASRARVLGRFRRGARLLGEFAGGVASLCGLEDSLIVLAELTGWGAAGSLSRQDM